MWSLAFPTDLARAAFRLRQGRLAFSYPTPGCTRTGTPPAGYTVDHTRSRVGDADDFAAARAALQDWEAFPRPWVRIDPPAGVPKEGATVTVIANVFGVWWANACRVLYVIDEPGRYGFAYGTLPGHAERGEERFLVEDTPAGVFYDIIAYSRPHHVLARLGYPLTRATQKRFARDSHSQMAAAVRARVAVAVTPAVAVA